MIQKEKKDDPKKENQIRNNECEQNINKLSSLKEFPEISNLYGKKEIIKKKILFKKESIKSTDNESNISKKYASENLPNNNCSSNSIFKSLPNKIVSKETEFSTFSSFPPLNPLNYYFNNSQSFPFNNTLFQNNLNYLPPIYLNYNYLNNICPSYPSYYSITNNANKNFLLNKKRNSDNAISLNPKKVQVKILKLNDKNEKKNLFEISKKFNNKINESTSYFKIKKNKEKIHCNHFGCDIFFKTKKQSIFHHFKMSRECQEDTICIIKLIFETKKIALKNIKKEKLENFSKLYENAMKEISLIDYINTITGLNLRDNI